MRTTQSQPLRNLWSQLSLCDRGQFNPKKRLDPAFCPLHKGTYAHKSEKSLPHFLHLNSRFGFFPDTTFGLVTILLLCRGRDPRSNWTFLSSPRALTSKSFVSYSQSRCSTTLTRKILVDSNYYREFSQRKITCSPLFCQVIEAEKKTEFNEAMEFRHRVNSLEHKASP